MTNTTDTTGTTRRTLAQAMRMPQWRRLIDSVHQAQAAQGFEGRQFGKDEMRFFGSSLIGKPVTHVQKTADEFSAYWVERQELELSDGAHSVRYVLKAIYGDNLANVRTITMSPILMDPTPAADASTAAEFIARARNLAGKWS